VRRLATGLLAGIAVLAIVAPLVVAVPDTVRIPIGKPHPTGTPQEAALFSHWGHGKYRCFACHPSVFPQALVSFTHADMNEGRFCAACHGRGEAPAVTTYACEKCHVPR
jgi:c(7)-type cytochrome triheme protein